MSVVHQNKWYVEPVPEEETEGWLLTYLDLITLLLVLLVVMLALSGQATRPATGSGLLPAGSGLLPGGSAPVSIQVVPPIEAPAPAVPVLIPAPAESMAPPAAAPSEPAAPVASPDPVEPSAPIAPAGGGAWPAIVAQTEWDPPAYAPGLSDPDPSESTLFVELPSYFLAEPDADAVLRHVMGIGPVAPASAPAPAPAPAAPRPAPGGMGMLALPELGDDIEIIRKRESISFRINSEILYSSAKADLSLEGLAVLRKLLPVLRGSDYIITVEGHTDALPIRGGQYPSNWELSSARAGRVVRYLAANGVGRARLRAIGYADTRPLADNDTEQGRASNRRVEIILEPPPAPEPDDDP